MDITLNIPLNAPIPAFSLAELRNALQEYALSWIAKTNAHKQQKTDEFELPEEFEKLCGSISQDKLKALAPNDERINHFI